MNLSSLARREKRLKDWSEFLATEVHDEELCRRTSLALQQYRNLLTKCWENGEVGEEDETQLQSAERELEELNEEARMTVVPRDQRGSSR